MAAKEALHIARDPRSLYLALGMPVVMLLLFGYGVSFDIDHIALAVVDQDRTEESRTLVDAFTAASEFSPHAARDVEDAQTLLRRGKVLAALVIPKGYQQRLADGTRADAQLLVDGADGVVANTVLSKSEAIARAQTLRLAARAGLAGAPPLSVKVWTRFNPAGRSALFLVPGLAAYLLAIAAVLLTALTIAGEWERGSMEQLFASPVGRLEVVVGKLVPYLVLGMIQLLLVLAVGASVFDVPMRGSLPLLFAFGFVFLVGMLGQGLLVSVVTRDQLVATQAGTLSALLPSLLLSGMLFPIENMPWILQWLSRVIPARYLVQGLRGILLKGSGWAELWPDLAAMSAFAVFVVAVSTARFRRRLA